MTEIRDRPGIAHRDRDGGLPHRRVITRRLGDRLSGKVNFVGEVTLATGVTTTEVIDDRVSPVSQISLSPLTANAAAMLPKIYVSSREEGSPHGVERVGRFVLTHPILTLTDYEYQYSVKG